jgi:diguanylate cyclase (GGDEF)-like protein
MQHNDLPGLADVVNSYKRGKIVTRAIVTDNLGKVLADTEAGEVGRLLSDENSKSFFESQKDYEIVQEDEKQLLVERPITLNDAVIGRVWMTFDKTFMQKELKQILTNGIIFALIAIFLGALVSVALAYSLTRKLADLLDVVRRVTNGARDARARDKSTDEIGQLAQGFNKMLETLVSKEKELSNFNAELEHRVEVRSREVSSAKNEAARISGELALTNEKITHLIFHDTLTGLYNRAFFEAEVRRLDVQRQLPLAIIIGVVNNARLVNETFGYKIGDDLIKAGGQVMKNVCRAEDIVVRYSDDIFLILLPNCDEVVTQRICDTIRKAAAEVEFEHIPLSIALGVAIKTEIEEDVFLTLIKAEERAWQSQQAVSSQVGQSVINGIQAVLAEQKPQTQAHVNRVTKLCSKFGTHLELIDQDLQKLELIACLHDVGKIVVADEVLNKSDELTPVEWEMLKRHSEISYKISSLAYGSDSDIAAAVYAHHEAWDGKGYPQGLSGERIPYLSRLLAIVDAFDAMTNDRSYYSAISQAEALKELKFCAGSQFDAKLVERFEEFINSNQNNQ